MPVYEKKHLKSCFKTSFGIYTSLSIQKEYQVIFFICNLFSDFFFFARALTTSFVFIDQLYYFNNLGYLLKPIRFIGFIYSTWICMYFTFSCQYFYVFNYRRRSISSYSIYL